MDIHIVDDFMLGLNVKSPKICLYMDGSQSVSVVV